ncbi:MAG: NAD(P)H-hydrate dehydratase [Verrucomicrobiota bacterium]
MNILNSSRMKLWESQAISAGATVPDLMRAAVNGCLKVIESEIHAPRPTFVFCGRGNNGNDGLTLAYELEKAGWPVRVILTHPAKDRVKPPFDYLEEFVQRAVVWPNVPKCYKPKFVIDAMLGLGARGPAHGPTKEIIEWCQQNKNNRDIYLSVDFPSGIDPDDGDGNCFPADITCAIGAVKKGCVRDKARVHVGKIFGITLPILDTTQSNDGEFVTTADAAALIRRLPPTAHKHGQGRVSVLGGAMPGAAILAAKAALRAGAGIVKFYASPEILPIALAQAPELITCPINIQEHLPEEFFHSHAYIIGPGMGRSNIMREHLFEMIPCFDHPVVLDADALFHLASDVEQLRRISAPFILTPHVKEMERLAGSVCEERAEIAERWVREKGGTLILKGPHTVIAEYDRPLAYNSTGNAGMATAGTGDVLSGILAGLLAQGYSPWDAARLGTCLHGLAADLAVAETSPQSLIASDVIASLGKSWNHLLNV